MYQLRVKPGNGYLKTIFFKMPKCGHVIEFSHTTPFRCPDCDEKPPAVDKLHGHYSTGARVKYFAERTL